MKPRTKLQKTVVAASEKLPPLTLYQEQQAVKHTAPHIAKYTAKGEYFCLDCGNAWKGDKSDKVICPHCKAKLTVETDRKRTAHISDYFAVITARDEFQVIRIFQLKTHLKKGEMARYWIAEAFQRWLTPKGDNVIVARRRQMMSWYYDAWDWSSDLEYRPEHHAHSVEPYKVLPRMSVISELKRNGFENDFHDCSVHMTLNGLLKNSKFETMWKAGHYGLVKHFQKAGWNEQWWPSIKIAIRHHYHISDASMWVDLLGALQYLHKDLHNPKLICPDNLKEAHDHWVQRKAAQQRREWEDRERELLMTQEERYLKDKERVKRDNADYLEAKSKFLDLVFKDNEITIVPLANVQEFMDEGRQMHHCVFSMRYYDKEESLILHAMVDGTSIATIEFNLDTMQIVQCRGTHNSVPELKDRITALIEANKVQIAKRKAA